MDEDLSRWLKEHAPAVGIDNLAPAITISAAARITGLSDSALRKYESAGLILYHRTSGNVAENVNRWDRSACVHAFQIDDIVARSGIDR